MCSDLNEEGVIFRHHKQQPLCTTRLPYRQGRKLTAVKVYTINNESNHLLIFGVPSLNLQHETKSLFLKFGKLLKFVITTDNKAEQFTETFHAVYDKLQSARIAKKMLDAKNYYGGCLHVSYAPEFESVEESQCKIMQWRNDVIFRLNNLKKEDLSKTSKNDIGHEKGGVRIDDCSFTPVAKQSIAIVQNPKLNMGEKNTIYYGNSKKRKANVIEKRYKPCLGSVSKIQKVNNKAKIKTTDKLIEVLDSNADKIEIIDFTSVDKETISNINDGLNYKEFGNEVVRKVAEKPMNVIKFNIDKH